MKIFKESPHMLPSQTGAQMKIIIFNPDNNKKETFRTKNMIVESNEHGEVQNQESQKTQSITC